MPKHFCAHLFQLGFSALLHFGEIGDALPLDGFRCFLQALAKFCFQLGISALLHFGKLGGPLLLDGFRCFFYALVEF